MNCKRLTIQKILVSCANRALNHSSGSSECLVLHKLRLEQQQRFILSRQSKSLASGAVIQNSLSIIRQTTNWRTCSQSSISSGQDALTVGHTEKPAPNSGGRIAQGMEQAEAQVQGERLPLEQNRSITTSDEHSLIEWSPLLLWRLQSSQLSMPPKHRTLEQAPLAHSCHRPPLCLPSVPQPFQPSKVTAASALPSQGPLFLSSAPWHPSSDQLRAALLPRLSSGTSSDFYTPQEFAPLAPLLQFPLVILPLLLDF